MAAWSRLVVAVLVCQWKPLGAFSKAVDFLILHVNQVLSCSVQLADPSLEVHLLQFWPSGVHHPQRSLLSSNRDMHEERNKITLWIGFRVAVLKLALACMEQTQNCKTPKSHECCVQGEGSKHMTAPGCCSVLPSLSSTAVCIQFFTHVNAQHDFHMPLHVPNCFLCPLWLRHCWFCSLGDALQIFFSPDWARI